MLRLARHPNASPALRQRFSGHIALKVSSIVLVAPGHVYDGALPT